MRLADCERQFLSVLVDVPLAMYLHVALGFDVVWAGDDRYRDILPQLVR